MGEGRLLTGWGRTSPSWARVVAPGDTGELSAELSGGRAGASGSASTTRIIARGLGRSYGDAAQCAGGTVIDVGRLSDIGPIDPESGLVTVGGGTSLQHLLERSLLEGWFVPVTPGTRQVSIGGAIAADVHGKNHHHDGSFCGHVTSLTLSTPTGIIQTGPALDPELFWATAGGMGLTGVVTDATVRMTPVETSRMLVDTERFTDLDGVMAAMEEGDAGYRYSVAWVDTAAGRKRAGRSVLTRGDHAAIDDLPASLRSRPLEAPRPARLRVRQTAPSGLLNAATVAAFNAAWYHRAPRRRTGELQDMATFFHPLDGVDGWNRLYGPRGFLQYQFAVGPHRGDVVHQAIRLLADGGTPSFLAVLKRFGPGDPGPLSFPIEGWTLALDLPLGPPELARATDQLDEMVAQAGGRVYLAKDARLRPELIQVMYPRLDELQEVRERVDPSGLLCSDLSRRLGMDRARIER
ncbi:MAG: FAD-binding oxidoreductase [Actinomycetota bacterium]|nr:FAD-binding oxidoreductase [Actinomycetota bacterium]